MVVQFCSHSTFNICFDFFYTSSIVEGKYILTMAICVSVALSHAAFPHYCMDLDVTWGNGRGCTLVVHC